MSAPTPQLDPRTPRTVARAQENQRTGSHNWSPFGEPGDTAPQPSSERRLSPIPRLLAALKQPDGAVLLEPGFPDDEVMWSPEFTTGCER